MARRRVGVPQALPEGARVRRGQHEATAAAATLQAVPKTKGPGGRDEVGSGSMEDSEFVIF